MQDNRPGSRNIDAPFQLSTSGLKEDNIHGK